MRMKKNTQTPTLRGITTLDSAIALIRQQEYMLSRQNELLDLAITDHNRQVAAGNEQSKQNDDLCRVISRLQKELEAEKKMGLTKIIEHVWRGITNP